MYKQRTSSAANAQQASATTTCQKCLKKGHYSYECKASVQSRPYASRPSRTQQLKNPNLKPSLTNQRLEALSTPSALGAVPAEAAEVEPRAEDGPVGGDDNQVATRRNRRSSSISSASSVATISTNKTDSEAERHQAASSRNRGLGRSVSERRIPDSSHTIERLAKPDRDLRRSKGTNTNHRDDRTARDRYEEKKKHHERRVRARSRSRSPPRSMNGSTLRERPRQRSLSPFSKRLALTQAMNAS